MKIGDVEVILHQNLAGSKWAISYLGRIYVSPAMFRLLNKEKGKDRDFVWRSIVAKQIPPGLSFNEFVELLVDETDADRANDYFAMVEGYFP